jgi:hypothetical protein
MAENAPAGPVKLGAIFVTMFAFPKRAILDQRIPIEVVVALMARADDDRGPINADQRAK